MREEERKGERREREKERKRRRVGQERRETEAQCPLTFISISLQSNYIPTTARLSHCTVPPCPCFVGGVFSSFLIWGKVGAVLWLSVCGCLSGWFLVFSSSRAPASTSLVYFQPGSNTLSSFFSRRVLYSAAAAAVVLKAILFLHAVACPLFCTFD